MSKSYKGDFKNHDESSDLYGYDIKNLQRDKRKNVRKFKEYHPGKGNGSK
jgi:hypothetical protein